MKSLLPAVIALSLALSACQRESSQQAPATAPDAGQATSTPAQTPAQTPAPGQPAPIAEQPPADGMQLAHYDGYGDLKLGSSGEQARAAWGGELNSSTPSEPGGCTLLTPKWATDKADVAFMVEGDKFVRYDVTTDKQAAPGGGKVGMDQAALKALYPALSESPHKYVEGAKYLSVEAPAPAGTKLVFETDAEGKVVTWRVGLPPQVDYVESCS